jgi:4-hydroxy-3-methylbut-2-enyl diphosphate reductase IspH
VLVVGSRNSSNSVRLVEVALDAGARAPTSSTTPPRSTSAGSTA